MFGRSHKIVSEIAAPALAVTPQREIQSLEESRAASEAEVDVLQGKLDKVNEEIRELHRQVAAAKGQAYPETPLGLALGVAIDRSKQLRSEIDEKIGGIENITKRIQAIERELPGRLRREALEAALPLVFELVDALCLAATHEAEYVSLGGHVEQSVPWELALAGGEGLELETIMSRWLKALQREGIAIPGDISDNSRHLPAPASHHARVQTDAGYMAHSARCGTLGGLIKGFRMGRTFPS